MHVAVVGNFGVMSGMYAEIKILIFMINVLK